MKSKLRLISKNFNDCENKLLQDGCNNARIYRYSEGGSFCLSWGTTEETILCITWCSNTKRVVTLSVIEDDCEQVKNLERTISRLCYDKYFGKELVREYLELFS